jgi:hypothetical protein
MLHTQYANRRSTGGAVRHAVPTSDGMVFSGFVMGVHP